ILLDGGGVRPDARSPQALDARTPGPLLRVRRHGLLAQHHRAAAACCRSRPDPPRRQGLRQVRPTDLGGLRRCPGGIMNPSTTPDSAPDSTAPLPEHRSGFVSFVGRPNAGKSTLTNALVGSKVVITSNKPQTTRTVVRGIVHRPDAQLILVDTPGLHRP